MDKAENTVRFLPLMILSVTALASVQISCSTIPFREHADSLFLITDQVEVYYDLKVPDEKHFLPYALSEISGLAYLPEDKLLCVDDESGKVFEYDLKSRKIVNAVTFNHPGDFEGVELVGTMVYVLESDGDLFSFPYARKDQTESKKFENKLSQKNDTEGLGYNPYSGRLLIACKEEEDIKGTNAKGKTVYEFDLEQEALIPDPIFEMTSKKMETFFERHRKFDYEKERIKFKPSAIAYNPLDGYFYLLASVGKMLIVIDKDANIRATYPIAPRILNQPEGITFSESGVMYISSEGEGDKGYIIRFNPKRKS
jgi:uncharacterized protein YjiK